MFRICRSDDTGLTDRKDALQNSEFGKILQNGKKKDMQWSDTRSIHKTRGEEFIEIENPHENRR